MNATFADHYRDALDGLPQQIAVINGSGNLAWVNKAWHSFSADNEGDEERTCVSANYLEACESATEAGDESAAEVYHGLKRLIAGQSNDFYYEYPCHSPVEIRWFLMRAKPLSGDSKGYWIISHENITERRFAEARLEKLAVTDSLTSLPNRRRFDDFLEAELRRSQRASQFLSLILLDIDHFKAYNDHYGHVEGDACLQKVAQSISAAARRPSDLAARYGGEEFALVLSQTGKEGAIRIAEAVLRGIRDLEIPNEGLGPGNFVTASIGLVAARPDRTLQSSNLVSQADEALYQSKENGRDTLTVYEERAMGHRSAP